MGGFFDFLALLLGWKSAPSACPPFRTAAGRVWHPGATAAQYHLAGQRAGQIFSTGQTTGKIHG